MISESSLPVAITQLKLCYAFRGHCPSILQCVTAVNDIEVMVVDDEQYRYSHITSDENQRSRCLLVKNTTQKAFYILAIDNCFVSNRPGGIADCVIFDELQFNFVEFKTNAKGNSVPQVEETYRNAYGQIVATYNFFRNKINVVKIDFDKVVYIKCYIVVSSNFPRVTAIEQNLMKEAADSDYHLDLSFEPEIQIIE